jgi:lipopolysaccharide/colanic/teichoic acid biosynthesis glycosyltransferase
MVTCQHSDGLSAFDSFLKRLFDIIFSLTGLLLFFPFIICAWVVATIETRSNGLFFQRRIGKNGKFFSVIKIKTMHHLQGVSINVTSSKDSRITKIGHFFRRTKIDELPQLWNVLIGNMSFVGPRPDVSGYADRLHGINRIILSVRPGITGPASIKYKNEGSLLARQEDPIKYNDEVIWPDKVKINRDYIRGYRFTNDIRYILQTFQK